MEEFFFEIADLFLRVSVEADWLHDAMWHFEKQEYDEETKTDIPEVAVTFCRDEYNGAYSEEVLLKDTLLKIFETEDTYVVKYNNSAWVECYVNEKYSNKSYVYLTERGRIKNVIGDVDREEVMYTIRDAFFFHMQKMGRIAIHSASFVYRDKVWMFSGKSGIGKTTHVLGWHENGYPIQDFNGDLTICYMKNGIAMAASAPWCGTSNVYCNQKNLLGGVVFIQQDFYNHVRSLTIPEAILHISARCLTPNWNRALLNHNLKIAEEIAPRIQCGLMECLADSEAVRMAKRFIDELYLVKELSEIG